MLELATIRLLVLNHQNLIPKHLEPKHSTWPVLNFHRHMIKLNHCGAWGGGLNDTNQLVETKEKCQKELKKH